MKKQDQILPQHKEMLEEIGERLRKIRKEKKLNGEDAAKNIGISLKTLYPMERGEINFQFTTLLQMLDYYGVSVYDFFNQPS
jgi:transcriptional regulator with XRE-family HTH domain